MEISNEPENNFQKTAEWRRQTLKKEIEIWEWQRRMRIFPKLLENEGAKIWRKKKIEIWEWKRYTN